MFADATTAAEQARAKTGDAPQVPALALLPHPRAHRVGEWLMLDGLVRGGTLRLARSTPDFRGPVRPSARRSRTPLQAAQGRFKATLLHRLAGGSIRLPPLRERREDECQNVSGQRWKLVKL